MDKLIEKQFKKYNLPRKSVLLMDLAITLASLVVAYLLRFNFDVERISFADVVRQQAFIFFPVYLLAYLWSGSYRGIIRHSSIQDASRMAMAVSVATGTILLLTLVLRLIPLAIYIDLPYSVVFIHAMVTSVFLMGFRIVIREMYETFVNPRKDLKKVLIFGAGAMGQITSRVLENDGNSSITVYGFIDDNSALVGKRLKGKTIYSEDEAFNKIIPKQDISEVIFAIAASNIKESRKKALFDRCLDAGLNIREVPPVSEWMDGQLQSTQIRDIRIEDLLGREPIWLDQQQVADGLRGEAVLVSGAAGSIGSEIVRQLMGFQVGELILLDQAESGLYDLHNELLARYPDRSCEVVVASVTVASRMRHLFEKYRPAYVFNAAAYKHVPLMEAHPSEAIRVNIGGTRLLADLSVEFGVKKFVMISTDKAVNPTNVMGASKRICEIYIQSLAQLGNTATEFITTRFGNVLGSNGSVVPLFRKQIEAGGPVTVTHPDIIRYFMTIPEACQLVLEAGFMGNGGEIFVFDMGEPVKIYDLAVKMITLAGLKPGDDIPITFTGLRPGEKLYEELLANEENTLPTHHPKIKRAKVRQHQFEIVTQAVDALQKATQTESNLELVKRMRALVPEFVPQNPEYCMCEEVLKRG